MQEWIKKGVTAVMAGLGGLLAAWGVVSMDTWVSVVDAQTIGVIAGVVGVIVVGVMNKLTDWAYGMFMKAKTEETKPNA